MILTWLGYALVAIGVFFALLGSVGLYRLPDFYTRAHAATKTDTLGLFSTMLGLACLTLFDDHGLNVLNPLKLMLIALFVLVANPAAAHALGHAADRIGLPPWLRPGSDGDQESRS